MNIDREMRDRIIEIHTREGKRRGLSTAEIADVIAYDIDAHGKNEIIPTRELEAVMDFMEWKHIYAIEQRIRDLEEGEFERYKMGSGR